MGIETIQSVEQKRVGPQNLEKSLCTGKMTRFFGLSDLEISEFLDSVEFSGWGVSPMFLSPGYGSNNSLRPKILMTVLNNRMDTYQHEARHGLYFKLCCVMFERADTSLQAFQSFCKNVLGDKEFLSYIERNGSDLQKKFIQDALHLQEKEELLSKDISGLAVELGALTYQHAYFVDPHMCEAVASYGDTGATKVVGNINRAISSLVPYHSTFALKGYGDRESQALFENADIFQKTFMIRRCDYERKLFFNSA